MLYVCCTMLCSGRTSEERCAAVDGVRGCVLRESCGVHRYVLTELCGVESMCGDPQGGHRAFFVLGVEDRPAATGPCGLEGLLVIQSPQGRNRVCVLLQGSPTRGHRSSTRPMTSASKPPSRTTTPLRPVDYSSLNSDAVVMPSAAVVARHRPAGPIVGCRAAVRNSDIQRVALLADSACHCSDSLSLFHPRDLSQLSTADHTRRRRPSTLLTR